MSELEDGLAHALAVLAVTLAILFYLGWWRIPRTTIADHETALIYRHGRFSRQVGPGRHFVFPGSTVRRCRTIPQTLHIRPPDMLTRDGIPVRATALVTFRIALLDVRVGPLTVGPDVRRMLIAAARDRATYPTAGA